MPMIEGLTKNLFRKTQELEVPSISEGGAINHGWSTEYMIIFPYSSRGSERKRSVSLEIKDSVVLDMGGLLSSV